MSSAKTARSVGLPIMLAGVVLSIVFFFLLSWQPSREARKGFESKAESLSRMLAQTVRAAVEFEDPAGAERDLSTAKLESSIVYISVRKADGSVLVAVPKGEVPSIEGLLGPTVTAKTVDDRHHVGVPILAQDKKLGWLQVGFSTEEVRQSNAGTRVTSALVSFVFALASVVLGWAVGRSVANRDQLTLEIATTAARLRDASQNIQNASNEQAASTTQQAAAIEQTRNTMASLLEAAKRIADASQEVFKNADHTSRTTLNITDAIKQLTSQAQKISDISEVIRSISDKSDLLALNASLEGTKAGDAGRGFALVAAEMRRLAESVMAAAREIKQLASNIRAASDSSVHAAEEGRHLAGKTSESAREITLVTVQQRNATEQVTTSMNEVSQLLARSGEGTRQTERAAQELARLADQLTRLTSQMAAQRARRQEG